MRAILAVTEPAFPTLSKIEVHFALTESDLPQDRRVLIKEEREMTLDELNELAGKFIGMNKDGHHFVHHCWCGDWSEVDAQAQG